MVDDYRVEAVESCRPIDRADFLRVRRIYTLLRLRDGLRRRLKRPQNPGWTVGSLVQVGEGEFHAGRV